MVFYIYNGILLSHKKNEIMSFEATMDATRDYHTKCSKSEKKKKGKHHIISLICRILYMTKMNISMKQNQGHKE